MLLLLYIEKLIMELGEETTYEYESRYCNTTQCHNLEDLMT
jgi:hypothetical protein